MKLPSRAFIKKTTPLKSFATALFAALVLPLGAQTFNGQGGLLIPPGAPGQTVGITQSPCTVAGVGTLGGCLQIANVTMDINHTFTGDVGILLVAPNGAFLDLTTGNGGGGNNWTNCVFSDQAGAFITTSFPPYTGSWRPEGRATTLNQPYSNANPLGTFTFANTFTGINADGVWNLYVNDYVAADVGVINSWSITFTNSGTPPPAFPASISACPGPNGLASFNLTTLNGTVNGGSGLPVTYYLNSDATSPIGNPSNFLAPASTIIYAVVMGGCPSAIVPITVTVTPASLPPSASVTVDPPTNCGPIQGSIVFNLGIPGPVQISYSINGSTNQTFTGTTNVAGTLTIPYQFLETVTVTLLTATQLGGCTYSFPPLSDQFILQQGPTIAFNGPNVFCQGQTLDLSTFVTSNEPLTFHTGNPPTPGNQLLNPIVVLQSTAAYYAFAQAANGCTTTAFVPLNVTPSVTPVLSPATICENSGPLNLIPLQNPAFPNGVWSGPGVTGTTFNPLGLLGGNTLTFTSSSNCTLPATTTVTVVPSNIPTLGTTTICSVSGPLNLTTLQDPAFPNGTWSGPGVTGNTFNPIGFNGQVSLVFTPNQNCSGPATTQVLVQAALQPFLGTVTLCNTDAPINLNTLADPNFPSGGVWSGPGVNGIFFNPANLVGPISLLFTPTGAGCFSGGSTIVQVNGSPNINLGQTTICENAGLFDLGFLQDPNFPNGIWSGPGIIGGNFNPIGQTGSNTLTFTPNVACGVPVTTTIVVSPVPAAPVLGMAELCANNPPYNLTALQDPAFPNGVWSGPGVIGSVLNLANLSGTITLTFTSNQACVGPATTEVQITPVVQPILGSTEICPGDPLLNLATLQDPAFPIGIWSGPGVGGSFFNPANLVGPITLVFTPQGSNCAVASSTVIEVTIPPVPMLSSATLCESGGLYGLSQLLDPNFPTGVWSGPGITGTGNSFNPQGLPGINTLTFTPSNPCTASATTTITVSAPATPTLGTATVCSSDAPLNLATLLTAGGGPGLWSGQGVSGGLFNPTGLSGPIALTFTPSGACTAPATTTLTVSVTQEPTLSTATLCQNSGLFDLSALTPPGFGTGIWSGPGVTGNQLDPEGLSGNIALTFTPSVACALPGNTTIIINASAPPSFTTQFSGTLCPADCLEAAPALTGNGPFNLIFEIEGPQGSALDTLQIANSGASISICPSIYDLGTGAYTLTALEISDANCQQPLNLPLGAFQIVAPMAVLSTTLCPGEELIVGNQTFNEANPTGTVTLAGASVNGCDSLVQVSLSFLTVSDSLLNQTLCNGQSLTIGTQTFDAANPAGTVLFPNAAASGCDSTVQVSLSFFAVSISQLNQTLCNGQTLTVGNQTFDFANPAGTVLFPNAAASGCDSLVQVFLSFFPTSDSQLNQTLCTGQTLTVGSQLFDATNPTGTVLLPNAAISGCDSTVTVSLTFQNAITATLNQTLCTGQTLTVGGQLFDATNPSGSVLLPNAAASGCDSIVTVSLIFNNPVTAPLNLTLCNGEALTVGNQTFNAANPTGTVLFPNAAASGCDSTVLVSLSFFPASISQLDQTLCNGEALTVGNQTFNAANPTGTVLFPNAAFSGCDSTVLVSLSFFPASTSQLNQTLCNGETLTVGSQTFNAANPTGNVLFPNAAASGCDSTVLVSLSFFPASTSQLNQTLCNGETLTVGSQTFNAANPTGTVLFPNAAASGCDSTVLVSLSFFPASNSQLNQTLCNGETLTVGSQTFNATNPTGTVLFPNAAASGCDSTVLVSLSFFPASNSQLAETLCNGETLTVGSQTFNAASPTGTVLFPNAAASGCDSTVQVSLSFFPASISQLNQTLCNGETLTVGNQTFNATNPTGTVLFPNAAASGCDSTVQVSLSFFPASTSQLSQTLCNGETLTVGSQTFNAANPTGTVLFPNAAASGCDSTVQVSLSFFPASISQLSQTLCNGETLTVGNQTFNAANPMGTVLFPNAAASGCDSTVAVSLTFLDTITTNLSATICEGESYPFNDQLLTVAGMYSGEFTTISGCDSLVTLNLAVAEPPQVVIDSVFNIVSRTSVTLNPQVSGSVSCTWQPASLVECSTCCNTRTISMTSDTLIVLYVTADNGCEAAFPVSIRVNARPGFYAPNAFRPDSPANGYFTLYGTDAIEEIEEMMVFTRWGESVFRRTNFLPDLPQLGWDGRYRGQIMDVGVFVWFARLRLRNGKVIVEKGDITLVR